MNPEQQRIAIAEACGWRCTAAFKEAIACWVRPNGMDHQTEFIPDYLNDLNAMHEAEKMLTPDIRLEYLCQLFDAATMSRPDLYPVDESYLSHHATASQRAEAFLRTIGKWKVKP